VYAALSMRDAQYQTCLRQEVCRLLLFFSSFKLNVLFLGAFCRRGAHCDILLVCVAVFSVACQQWTSKANIQYDNGVIHPASSVEQCMAACVSSSQCTGLGWAELSFPGLKCWLHGPWSGTLRINPFVTYYSLNRNCRGELQQFGLICDDVNFVVGNIQSE